MSLVLSHYVKSKTLYALDRSTFEVIRRPSSQEGHPGAMSMTVEAIWTASKKGKIQVCYGQLHNFVTNDKPDTYEYFLEDIASNYGGTPFCRWDGEYMWAPNTPLRTMIEWSDDLDPVLNNLPEVPAGFEGWYALK